MAGQKVTGIDRRFLPVEPDSGFRSSAERPFLGLRHDVAVQPNCRALLAASTATILQRPAHTRQTVLMHDLDVPSPSKRPRRPLIAAMGIVGLILASLVLVPIRQPRLFLVELESRHTCDQLSPAVRSVTDRLELTGASWLGGERESGYCVIAAEVTGYNAMATVSETRVIQFLRDEVGMSETALSNAIVLENP